MMTKNFKQPVRYKSTIIANAIRLSYSRIGTIEKAKVFGSRVEYPAKTLCCASGFHFNAKLPEGQSRILLNL
jgi:hypothetical protein